MNRIEKFLSLSEDERFDPESLVEFLNEEFNLNLELKMAIGYDASDDWVMIPYEEWQELINSHEPLYGKITPELEERNKTLRMEVRKRYPEVEELDFIEGPGFEIQAETPVAESLLPNDQDQIEFYGILDYVSMAYDQSCTPTLRIDHWWDSEKGYYRFRMFFNYGS